jgi:hypothetical protein
MNRSPNVSEYKLPFCDIINGEGACSAPTLRASLLRILSNLPVPACVVVTRIPPCILPVSGTLGA